MGHKLMNFCEYSCQAVETLGWLILSKYMEFCQSSKSLTKLKKNWKSSKILNFWMNSINFFKNWAPCLGGILSKQNQRLILTVVHELVVVPHRSAAVSTALGFMTRSHTLGQRYRGGLMHLFMLSPSAPLMEMEAGTESAIIVAMSPRKMKIWKQRAHLDLCTLSVSVDGAM